MGRLANFRAQSVPPHSIVKLGNRDESLEVAIVLLSVDAIKACEEEVARYNKETGFNDGSMDTMIFNLNLVRHCLRDVNDLTIHLASGVSEIEEGLSLTEIEYVVSRYSELEAEHSPASINLLTEEEFAELKKNLGQTRLKDLNIASQAHLKSFLLIRRSEECLTSNGYGSIFARLLSWMRNLRRPVRNV